MRQLNSLGQVLPVDSKSTAVTFKDLKNDQHQLSQDKSKPKKKNKKKVVDDIGSEPLAQEFVERRSGKERRKDEQASRKRWIESRQTKDRRKNNQLPKVSFII